VTEAESTALKIKWPELLYHPLTCTQITSTAGLTMPTT